MRYVALNPGNRLSPRPSARDGVSVSSLMNLTAGDSASKSARTCGLNT